MSHPMTNHVAFEEYTSTCHIRLLEAVKSRWHQTFVEIECLECLVDFSYSGLFTLYKL